MSELLLTLAEQANVSSVSQASENRSDGTFDWLPEGKRAAVCFSIDDLYPGIEGNTHNASAATIRDGLGHLLWLLERHPLLRATLFTTADWREISPLPTRRFLARIPYLRERFFLTDILPIGTMRLSNHPEFVQLLRQLPRVEIGLHGLHHVHRGLDIPVEFQKQGAAECRRILREMIAIFDECGLEYARVMNPPGWRLTESLANAMIDVGIGCVSSARDIRTPVARAAMANMSGLKGVSLIYPESICDGRLLHITSNFQATCAVDRALEVLDRGGLLAIKAHAIKTIGGYTALDGLDEPYRNYLDLIFTTIEDKYGDSLWWTSMGELTDRYTKDNNNESASKAGICR
ncbi:MAG: hypothetical protein QOJ64_1176 [Acidobacteriota bacterium]|jgi:hypothetical protein|nr:hypothetical protein [Acidobacteriota bacterium]